MKKNIYFTILRIVALVGALAVIALLAVSSSAQKTSYDNNVLFVLDLSYSMNAQDISTGSSIDKITRLEAAKQIIKQAVEAGGEANYGLVIFSQSATQYVPLTADTGTFLDYIKDVNTGLLPGGGTDRNSLQKIFSGGITDYAKIIFISDAETEDKIPSWKTLKNSNVYFVGVGTEAGGNPKLPDGTIMKKGNSKNIISSFDAETADAISKTLHATSFQIDRLDRIDSVIDEIVLSSPSFSYSEIQILVVILGIFILLVL